MVYIKKAVVCRVRHQQREKREREKEREKTRRDNADDADVYIILTETPYNVTYASFSPLKQQFSASWVSASMILAFKLYLQFEHPANVCATEKFRQVAAKTKSI